MMIRILRLALRGLCGMSFVLGEAGMLLGDSESTDRASRFFRPSPRAWSVDLELSSVFDSNINQNREDLDSQGVVARIVVRAQKQRKGRLLRVEYDAGAQTYTNTSRFDSARSEFAAMFFQRLGSRVTGGAIGGYSVRVLTDDREIANQYSAWSQLEYRPRRSTRLGVYGGYQSTRLGEATEERMRLLGADLGTEIANFSLWEAGYRYEESDSPTTGRGYNRSIFHAEYALRIGDRNRFRIRVEHRKRRFPAPVVTLKGSPAARVDRRWRPSLLWVHDFKGGTRLQFAYELQRRAANDARQAFEGYRAELTLRLPLLSRYRPPGAAPNRDFPIPRLPEGAGVSEPSVLEQLRVVSERAEQGSGGADAFSPGSHWKEVLAAQGIPSKVSQRPLFYEELWFYGPSWVVLRHGRVTSWHDSGNLKVAASAEGGREDRRQEEVSFTTRSPVILSLVELAGRSGQRPLTASPLHEEGASQGQSPRGEAELVEETVSLAFQKTTEAEIVLKDGTRLKGYVKKYENGLAYVLLFLPNNRTLFATLPGALIDRERTTTMPDS